MSSSDLYEALVATREVLRAEDLSPELAVSLDIWISKHPDVDLSGHTLHQYGGNEEYFLESPVCAAGPGHAEGCHCVFPGGGDRWWGPNDDWA